MHYTHTSQNTVTLPESHEYRTAIEYLGTQDCAKQRRVRDVDHYEGLKFPLQSESYQIP
jgi:hypothetical protein